MIHDTSLDRENDRHPLSIEKLQSLPMQILEMSLEQGAVKITPAHDFNDYAVGKRHNLAMINMMMLMELNAEGLCWSRPF